MRERERDGGEREMAGKSEWERDREGKWQASDTNRNEIDDE